MIFKTGKIDLNSMGKEISGLNTEEKICQISKYFLGLPYKKNSLIGSIETEEILTVDFEGVDCMTFIEYVEAIRVSENINDFIENLKKVRYFNGKVDFKKRRHFFTDWNSLENVEIFTEKLGESFCKHVEKVLNKKNENEHWIEGLPIKKRTIIYIPTSSFLDIVKKLDSVYYCGFYTSMQGLDVKHVGILIKEKNLILRHASSIKGKVVDVDFVEYIKDKEGIILYKPI